MPTQYIRAMNENGNKDRLISLHSVTQCYEGHIVLDDVSFDIDRGDFYALTGPNGGGKTTLLKILLKLIKPTKGSVEYFDSASSPLSIGYLPQKSTIDSKFPITVGSLVEYGLLGAAESKDKELSRNLVKEALERVEMTKHYNAPIGTLSGGQLQRTLFARAIISQPQLLVLDEPLSYLDRHFSHKLFDIIREMAANTTIVVVSHEVGEIATLANHHLIVDSHVHRCSSLHHFMNYDSCEK